MEQIQEVLDAVLQQTTFDGLPADEFRAIVGSHSWRDEAFEQARSAAVHIPDHPRSLLTAWIRTELDSFVDHSSDSIGHAFPIGGPSNHITGFQQDGTLTLAVVSTLDQFAKSLVRGAAVLGTERAVTLLDGWVNGTSIRYQVRTLLNGDELLSEPCEPVAGLRIESLPLSTDHLSGFLPQHGGTSWDDYLGRMVVTIEHTMAPALFRPGDEEAVQSVRAVGVPAIEKVCQAFALEVDSELSQAFSWLDFRELDAFCLTKRSSTWSTGQERFRSRSAPTSLRIDFLTGITTLELSPDVQLQLDRDRFRSTLMALDQADVKTRRAVSRWLRSMDTNATLDDRFIDMRIALESLYLHDFLNDHSQEMRFRLPLFAAWHLGADLSERRQLRKTVRRTYDTASGAVHAGHVESTPEHRDLLRDAQELCRRGILKLLEHGEPDDWGDVILGADVESA